MIRLTFKQEKNLNDYVRGLEGANFRLKGMGQGIRSVVVEFQGYSMNKGKMRMVEFHESGEIELRSDEKTYDNPRRTRKA